MQVLLTEEEWNALKDENEQLKKRNTERDCYVADKVIALLKRPMKLHSTWREDLIRCLELIKTEK